MEMIIVESITNLDHILHLFRPFGTIQKYFPRIRRILKIIMNITYGMKKSTIKTQVKIFFFVLQVFILAQQSCSFKLVINFDTLRLKPIVSKNDKSATLEGVSFYSRE